MSLSTLKILPYSTVKISANVVMIYGVYLPKMDKPEIFICQHPTIKIILQDRELQNLIGRLKE